MCVYICIYIYIYIYIYMRVNNIKKTIYPTSFLWFLEFTQAITGTKWVFMQATRSQAPPSITYLSQEHRPQHLPRFVRFFSASLMSWLIWSSPSSIRSSCSGWRKVGSQSIEFQRLKYGDKIQKTTTTTVFSARCATSPYATKHQR